jgi:hypothetical protein
MYQAPPPSQFSSGPATEPPVSPQGSALPPPESVQPGLGSALPAEAPSPPAREAAPIEAQLVKLGLLTVAQLAEANRERFQSGRSVLEIVQERGWISQKDMEVLFGDAAPPPAAEPTPQVPAEPEPVVAPEPAPVLVPTRRFNVAIRLVDGEFVDVTTVDDEDAAHGCAREVVADLSRPRDGDWPFYGGRFLRPDAIVSVDVVEEELV